MNASLYAPNSYLNHLLSSNHHFHFHDLLLDLFHLNISSCFWNSTCPSDCPLIRDERFEYNHPHLEATERFQESKTGEPAFLEAHTREKASFEEIRGLENVANTVVGNGFAILVAAFEVLMPNHYLNITSREYQKIKQTEQLPYSKADLIRNTKNYGHCRVL
nr:hypothetical protein Itr_chr14CG17980 [Ipomoea trifida]